MPNFFSEHQPTIVGNDRIRTPQLETFLALQAYAELPDAEREVGIVLPVGCGKSGCIAITPFAFGSKRTLVVAPNLAIAAQLALGKR